MWLRTMSFAAPPGFTSVFDRLACKGRSSHLRGQTLSRARTFNPHCNTPEVGLIHSKMSGNSCPSAKLATD